MHFVSRAYLRLLLPKGLGELKNHNDEQMVIFGFP
jgi:hypothetical protein